MSWVVVNQETIIKKQETKREEMTRIPHSHNTKYNNWQPELTNHHQNLIWSATIILYATKSIASILAEIIIENVPTSSDFNIIFLYKMLATIGMIFLFI